MKNDKNFKIKLVLLWVFAFSVMIFIMSMSANAEEPYFPMQQNQSGDFDDFLDTINSYIDGENYYYIMYKAAQYGDGVGFAYVKVPKEDGEFYAEISNDGFHWSLYRIESSAHISIGVLAITYNQQVYDIPDGSNYSSYFTNLVSSNYDTSLAYVSNYKIYTNNTDNAELVLRYGADDPIINTGVAVIPPGAFIPEYLTGDTPPQNVPPEYTVNNYTWTTAPQFDGSTVINGIQSIKNTLEWLSSNLHEELANLLNNIKGLATYIGKTIQYYGNAIIETINNAIQNFYDNMKALVEPIYTTLENLYNGFLEFADLFIHPFDEEEFEDQIENCQLISQYNELMDNADVIRAIFNNAEERDYFVLYIDFENPFADSEHKIIHSEISFTWLKNYRSTYRPFLWVFTMMECFIGGMRLLGGIIGGKAK